MVPLWFTLMGSFKKGSDVTNLPNLHAYLTKMLFTLWLILPTLPAKKGLKSIKYHLPVLDEAPLLSPNQFGILRASNSQHTATVFLKKAWSDKYFGSFQPLFHIAVINSKSSIKSFIWYQILVTLGYMYCYCNICSMKG